MRIKSNVGSKVPTNKELLESKLRSMIYDIICESDDDYPINSGSIRKCQLEIKYAVKDLRQMIDMLEKSVVNSDVDWEQYENVTNMIRKRLDNLHTEIVVKSKMGPVSKL